jgi:predicted dehydrogenase
MLKQPGQHHIKPRLAFLGVGWIGRHRMESILAADLAEVCGVCDPSPDMIAAARSFAADAIAVDTFNQLMDLAPDGVVIATPNALHAEQSVRALDRGIAVFCQKPLGRNRAEVAAVLEAGQRNNRLIGVDFSYRYTAAMQQIRRMIQSETIGRIYAVDLIFHNAYGPDKPWFYDGAQSGGGCVMDLGIHLVDLLLWAMDYPAVQTVRADLFTAGRRMAARGSQVEDYAVATLGLGGGAVAQLTCSWKLHAGRDAIIGATFHGTDGALAFANMDGSFYDFTAEIHRGTSRSSLAAPPDSWGGRAAQGWVRQLASNPAYDPQVESVADVAEVLDRIYAEASSESSDVASTAHPELAVSQYV